MDTRSLGAAEDQGKLAWDGAVSLLKRSGVNERQARSLFGRLLKQYSIQAHELLPAVRSAERIGTGDPTSYLTAAAKRVADSRTDPALKASWT